MFGFEMSEPMQAWTALAILAGMLVLFVREIYPVEVTALAGGALMLAVGILPQDDLLGVLSNPAPWTITALFIIVGSLVRTGTLDAVTQIAVRHAATRPPAHPRSPVACDRGHVGLHEQHAHRGGDDPGLHADRAADAGLALQGHDPAQLSVDLRRHRDADRHLHEPAGRRGGAPVGPRALLDLRDHAAGPDPRGRGPGLPLALRATPAGRPRQHGDAALGPEPDEVLHRGGRSRGLGPDRPQGRGCGHLQARQPARDRRAARRHFLAPQLGRGNARGRRPGGAAHPHVRGAEPAVEQGAAARRQALVGADAGGRGAHHARLLHGGPLARRHAPQAALRGLCAGRAPAQPEHRPPARRSRGAGGRHASPGGGAGRYRAAGLRDAGGRHRPAVGPGLPAQPRARGDGGSGGGGAPVGLRRGAHRDPLP